MADPGKVWQINLNGSGIKVEDLPLEVVDRITKASDVGSWFEVVNTPLLNLDVVTQLVAAAAEILGVEAPTLTPRVIVDLFVLVDDTVPVPDVVEPDPLVPAGPTTATPGSQP